MSARSIGRDREKKVKKELEEQGYIVYLVPLGKKFNTSVDIFSIFDIVAVHEHKLTIWIQVTSESTRGRLKVLKEFRKKDYVNILDKIQLWVYKKRKGFKIYDL